MPPTAPGEEFDAVFFPVGTPEWMAIYLEELFNTCKRARAAQAAGKSLPEIVRIRHADQEFAEREVAILMEAMGDALESEVIERVIPERDAIRPPDSPGKRSLLRSPLDRLLDIFHPTAAQAHDHEPRLTRPKIARAVLSRRKLQEPQERIAYQTWDANKPSPSPSTSFSTLRLNPNHPPTRREPTSVQQPIPSQRGRRRAPRM
jgi:hypothetical protein